MTLDPSAVKTCIEIAQMCPAVLELDTMHDTDYCTCADCSRRFVLCSAVAEELEDICTNYRMSIYCPSQHERIHELIRTLRGQKEGQQ